MNVEEEDDPLGLAEPRSFEDVADWLEVDSMPFAELVVLVLDKLLGEVLIGEI